MDRITWRVWRLRLDGLMTANTRTARRFAPKRKAAPDE